MKNLFKRRRFVVSSKFQFRLMIISYSYIIFFCAVMMAYLFIPLMMELDKSIKGSERALIAAERILYLHEKFWPALLLSLVAIGCHSIFVSHRIAGPLYRFNLFLKSMKEGILPTPLHIRKDDYLYKEMENFNQMLEQLRSKLTELKEAQIQLNRSIVECKDTVSRSSIDELIKKMENLSEQERKFEEKLEFFKVVPFE